MNAATQIETTDDAILNLFGEDARFISYRPRMAAFLGSATAAILLQQIIYWYIHNGKKPFYKFKERCNHEDYRDGDSWTEELAFGRSEFDTALSKIACKIVTGTTRNDYRQALVWYWTDNRRRTYYEVNVALLSKVGNRLYQSKVEIPRYQVKLETDFTYPTESTSESNQEIPYIAPDKPDAENIPAQLPTAIAQSSEQGILLDAPDVPAPPPAKAPKPPKPPKPEKPPTNPNWIPLCTAFSESTGIYGGQIGKVIRALLDGYPDVTPDELRHFYAEWTLENKPTGANSLPNNFGPWRLKKTGDTTKGQTNGQHVPSTPAAGSAAGSEGHNGTGTSSPRTSKEWQPGDGFNPNAHFQRKDVQVP
jgi:hypothetical protein